MDQAVRHGPTANEMDSRGFSVACTLAGGLHRVRSLLSLASSSPLCCMSHRVLRRECKHTKSTFGTSRGPQDMRRSSGASGSAASPSALCQRPPRSASRRQLLSMPHYAEVFCCCFIDTWQHYCVDILLLLRGIILTAAVALIGAFLMERCH